MADIAAVQVLAQDQDGTFSSYATLKPSDVQGIKRVITRLEADGYTTFRVQIGSLRYSPEDWLSHLQTGESIQPVASRWVVKWQTRSEAKRGGESVKIERKHFDNQIDANRYAQRLPVVADPDWVTVSEENVS